MTINETTYTSGTVRVYPEGSQIPRCHLEENREGGVGFDFGQFGFANAQARQAHGMDYEDFDYEEEQFKGFRQYMEYRIGRRPKLTDYLGLSFYKDDSNEEILDQMEETRNQLQGYYNRRDQRRVGYKPMSQLRIETPDGKRTMKRSSKSLKYCEDKLYERLFGNRKTINVKCLEISCPFEALRFPPSLKLKIQELKIESICGDDLNAYQQIIDPSCLPLKRVVLNDFNDYKYNIVKSAETLVIQKGPYFFHHEEMINALLQVSNRNVIVNKFNGNSMTCSSLIRRWIDQKRPIGSCWSFNFESGEMISSIMKELEKHGIRSSKRCINIRNDNDSMVKVSYEPSETEPVWVLKFEVVDVGI
uniref:FBA_2 domain-containing protein n=1 Tax=Caenorhabditis tropicalis TaxID=1561998 RepID=A0A1I7TCI9_9PELO